MKYFDIHQHLNYGTDVDAYAKEMRKLNMRAAVNSVGPMFGQPGNKATLDAMKRHPDVIVGFGYIGLGRGDTPQTVQKLYNQGFRGLKMIIPKKDYDDKSYYPIYRKAEELNMPILFHTGIMAGTEGICKHYQHIPEVAKMNHAALDVASRRMEPITLDAVARAFPKLKIIMAHFTADNRKESISGMLMWLPNVYADLTNVTWYFPRHHTLYMGKLIKELMGKNIPREKLIFGTDTVTSNLGMVPKQRKTVEDVLKVAQFKKSEIEMIMGGTMNSWFPVR